MLHEKSYYLGGLSAQTSYADCSTVALFPLPPPAISAPSAVLKLP